MRWKLTSKYLYALLILCVVSSTIQVIAPETPLISGEHFNIFVKADATFMVTQQFNVTVIPLTTDLNGSDSSITVYQQSGRFGCIPTVDNVLNMTLDTTETVEVKPLSGLVDVVPITATQYHIQIYGNQGFRIKWGIPPVSFIDLYFYLGMGMFGVILMIFAPTWVAYSFANNGISEETLKRLFYAVFFFILGFGLFVSWLWLPKGWGL